jgi:hypothetical protein
MNNIITLAYFCLYFASMVQGENMLRLGNGRVLPAQLQ